MPQLILHAGMNKTGSSSIQHVLGTNAPRLADQGVVYPGVGRDAADPAHHDFARVLKRGDAAAIRGMAEDVIKEMAATGASTALLSSELFSTLRNTDALRLVLDQFDSTRLYIYLREHAVYIMSWYQQSVQGAGNDGSMDDFLLSTGRRSLGDRLDPWLGALGEDAVHVRLFERAQLVNEDVVDDFITWSGLGEPTSYTRLGYDDNVSISGNLLVAAKMINRRAGTEVSKSYIVDYQRLSGLKPSFTGPIEVPMSIVARINEVFADDREQLRELGVIVEPRQTGIEGNRVPDPDTWREDLADLTRAAKRDRLSVAEPLEHLSKSVREVSGSIVLGTDASVRINSMDDVTLVDRISNGMPLAVKTRLPNPLKHTVKLALSGQWSPIGALRNSRGDAAGSAVVQRIQALEDEVETIARRLEAEMAHLRRQIDRWSAVEAVRDEVETQNLRLQADIEHLSRLISEMNGGTDGEYDR